MKNKLIFIFIIGAIIFLIIPSHKIVFDKNEIYQPGKDNKNKIAILLPAIHPALEEIKQGFIETLEKSLKADFDIFNANGNRILLRAQAEEIIQKNYDLVFSIATAPSIILKEITKQRNKNIPIVCSAVTNPVEIGLIKSYEASDNNLVVISSGNDFEKQINTILFLKPNIKKVLLVYSSQSNINLQQDKNKIEKILNNKKINLLSLEIFNTNEIGQKASGLIEGCDLILVLKDNLVVSGIESLVNLCNRHQIPLYVSDLNSVDKGATCGFGIREYDYGVEGAKKAIEILHNSKKPAEIASLNLDNFKFKININALKKHKLNIDERTLFFIRSGEAI